MNIEKDHNDNIDSVFQKMLEDQPEMDQEALDSWELSFESKIQKQNFFRFGLNHFNVFTAISLGYTAVSLMAGSGYLIYQVFASTQPTTNTSINPNISDSIYSETKIPAVSDKTSTQDAPILISSDTKTKPKKVAPENTLYHPADTKIQPEEETAEPVIEKTDVIPTQTSTTEPNITPSATKTPFVKIEKKTFILEKRDTLEQIDTIRSKKEWRRLNKNK